MFVTCIAGCYGEGSLPTVKWLGPTEKQRKPVLQTKVLLCVYCHTITCSAWPDFLVFNLKVFQFPLTMRANSLVSLCVI